MSEYSVWAKGEEPRRLDFSASGRAILSLRRQVTWKTKWSGYKGRRCFVFVIFLRVIHPWNPGWNVKPMQLNIHVVLGKGSGTSGTLMRNFSWQLATTLSIPFDVQLTIDMKALCRRWLKRQDAVKRIWRSDSSLQCDMGKWQMDRETTKPFLCRFCLKANFKDNNWSPTTNSIPLICLIILCLTRFLGSSSQPQVLLGALFLLSILQWLPGGSWCVMGFGWWCVGEKRVGTAFGYPKEVDFGVLKLDVH